MKRQSLILKISVCYGLVTLFNLLIFWLAAGGSNMRLVAEKATSEASAFALGLERRLEPLRQNVFWRRQVIHDPMAARQAMLARLEQQPQSQVFLVPKFQLVSAPAGIILMSYPDATQLGKGDSNLTRNSLKSMLLLETQKKSFLAIPDEKADRMAIFIPLAIGGAEEFVFATELQMPSIRKEYEGLIKLWILMIAVMLLLQVLIGAGLYQMVLVPVRDLTVGAEKVSGGDLQVLIPVKDKKFDELGRLGRLFNTMVKALEEKTTGLETALQELVRRDKVVQYELDLAQNIQQGIIPQPLLPGFELSVYYAPLEKVSGDYYDLFRFTDGSSGILIADVSGHGVPAALVTIMAKMYFSTLVRKFPEPAVLFDKVNRRLSKAVTTSDYLTAFYLRIRPDLTAEYCNASHQMGLILRRDDRSIIALDTPGFFIGASEELPMPYETHQIKLFPGDRIILYTDGIIEGTNQAGQEYGFDRFCKKIRAYAHMGINEFKLQLVQDIEIHGLGCKRKDDSTLLCIEILDNTVKAGATHAHRRV